MGERRIVVPEGMLEAAGKASNGVDPEGHFLYLPIEAALCWLDAKLDQCVVAEDGAKTIKQVRRMFLAPEPSVANVDAAIPDLLLDAPTHILIEEANRKIREAYRRGQKSGAK